MDKKIEQARKEYLQSLDELECEIEILSDRIKKAREIVPTIQTMEDVERFNAENDLEEGLEHIELFWPLTWYNNLTKLRHNIGNRKG